MYPKMSVRINANKGLGNLMNHSLENLNNIKEYSLENIYNEINDNIIFSLNQEDPGYLHSEDIQSFISHDNEKGFAEIIKNFAGQICNKQSNPDNYSFFVELIKKILANFKKYIETCISNKFIKSYFDIIDILYSTYKISVIIILTITKIENEKCKDKFKEILEFEIFDIFNTLLFESSYHYEDDLRWHFQDYLTIYCLILALMIIENRSNPFKEIILKWINILLYLVKIETDEITESKKLLMDYLAKLYFFLDDINQMIHKEMPEDEIKDKINIELIKISNKIFKIQPKFSPPYFRYISFDDLPEWMKMEVEKAENLFFNRD